MESKSLDHQYLQSEEFYDLVIEILSQVVKSRQGVKLRALAAVLVGAVTDEKGVHADLRSTFVRYIGDLSETHLEILLFFEENEADLVEIGSYPKLFEKFLAARSGSSLDKYEFKLYASELEFKALVSFGGGSDDFDDARQLRALSQSRPNSVKLTSVGKQFMEYLTRAHS